MTHGPKETAVIAAVNRLHYRRHVLVDGSVVELVLLVHPDGQRPLQAEWWSGKEASIIGVDISGNFVLRCSDGSVVYWSHRDAKATVVAPSVREFIASIH